MKSNNCRKSNIELYRIIIMLLIIAHHYVVNSGLINANGPILLSPRNYKSIFLLLFGAWGKIGINCFVLITGYFMCKSNITLKKFLKLFLIVIFYNVVISMFFWITGYDSFSLKTLIKCFLPITEVTTNFTGTYLLFYLCIPFLNILIKNMNQRQHELLLIWCSCIYVVFGTIRKSGILMNYVTWYIILYFIASYIRLYPKKIYKNKQVLGLITLVSIFLSALSVVILSFVYSKFGITPYYFVTDSNTFLAVVVSVSSFLFFINLDLGQNKIINTISATTFGILQIHTNSDLMRKFLWEDIFKNVKMFQSSYCYMHAICAVICVFVVCSIIDIIRIKLIERPVLEFYDKKMLSFKKN